MNDAELNRILKSAESPRRPEGYWQDFPDQVARQLNRPWPREHCTVRWVPRLVWAGGVAAVCIIAGFILGRGFAPPESANGNSKLLQSEKLIREILAMFPNRVRAIVKDELGIQLVLADEADVPESTPLWVKFCQGTRCTTLVTFSGQELQIAGQELTVLSDANGNVILTGDRFAWASDDPAAGGQNFMIQARAMQFASR